MKKILLIIFLVPLLAFASSKSLYDFKEKADEDKFFNLIANTRCVVCQNQSIADSNAALANDLRNKIYTLVLEKKTTTEIEKYLTARYGNFILLKPPLESNTLILWLFPLIASCVASIVIYKNLIR